MGMKIRLESIKFILGEQFRQVRAPKTGDQMVQCRQDSGLSGSANRNHHVKKPKEQDGMQVSRIFSATQLVP